jgi:thiol-disulfide isomerase/thioredoxin
MPLRLRSPLPSLEGAVAWLNTPDPTGPGDAIQPDRPLLVHFWAVSCGLCKEAMPLVNTWRDTYGPQGLQVLAVHMPLEQADTDLDRIRQAADRLGLTQPIAVDSRLAISDRFLNQFTPAYYLFDTEGQLRHYQAGAKGLEIVEQRIQRVLEEAGGQPGG